MNFYSDTNNIIHFFIEDIKSHLLTENLPSLYMIISESLSITAEIKDTTLFISLADENGENTSNGTVIKLTKTEQETFEKTRKALADLLSDEILTQSSKIA